MSRGAFGAKAPRTRGCKKKKEKKRKEKRKRREKRKENYEIGDFRPCASGYKTEAFKAGEGTGRGLTSGTSSQECVYVVVTHPIVGMSKNLSAKNGLSAKGEKRRGEGKKRENVWSGDQT